MRYRTLNTINNIVSTMIYISLILMLTPSVINIVTGSICCEEYDVYFGIMVLITLLLMYVSVWLEVIVINWDFIGSADVIDELFQPRYHASHYSFIVLRGAVKWYIKARKISDAAVEKAYEEYTMGCGKEPAIEHGERVLRFMTHLKFKASNTANNY